MTSPQTVAAEIVRAISEFADLPAMSGQGRTITYRRLGQYVSKLGAYMTTQQVVGIFGSPGVAMGASAVACVINGRPFVHLDPAMPQMVLHNIVSELDVSLIVTCEEAAPGDLPNSCATVDASDLLNDAPTPYEPLRACPVAPDDPIYLVATSGTTGRPKCIPVAQDAAYLSYEWRDAFTPYGPDMRVGIYIFAIWEMFRPLRKGASLWFPSASTLFAPGKLADFLITHDINEMLFTPSYYDTFLNALDAGKAAILPLTRVVLNGEVVSDDLIIASLAKLPSVAVWNLYSICETHDVCMSQLTEPAGDAPASVGIPMDHLRAVILDHDDVLCPKGVSGLLHFEGPRMLGPGYVNRPEETRLRFRKLTIEGRETRLYDTGDQAWVDDTGALHIEGRIAHMLKLRGFSIQTKELTDTMRDKLSFSSAAPWVTRGRRTRSESGVLFCNRCRASAAQCRKLGACGWYQRHTKRTCGRSARCFARLLRAVIPCADGCSAAASCVRQSEFARPAAGGGGHSGIQRSSGCRDCRHRQGYVLRIVTDRSRAKFSRSRGGLADVCEPDAGT